ncbi:MAG: class I SAM-dependent methyltransferase [Cyanobacteria bacterium P01_D01_bin.105]
MTKVAVNLGSVQETLLIPLLGRAVQTQRKNGLIQDEKAVQIVESLDYDFSKWKKAQSLAGATFRTRMYDQDVQSFLAEHPTGTVVEIGCGLNTRFERLDNGQAHWFDLDLPDTIALRRQFFQDQPRRTMLEASVLDTDWMEPVAATGGPWCFISEAVLIYLEAAQVRQAVTQIAARFPDAWLLIDTTSQKMVEGQATHDAMKYLPQASWFRWACDDPSEIESWGNLQLVRSRSFLDADDELKAQMPWPTKFFVQWFPWLLRRKIEGYRLNKFMVRPL